MRFCNFLMPALFNNQTDSNLDLDFLKEYVPVEPTFEDKVNQWKNEYATSIINSIYDEYMKINRKFNKKKPVTEIEVNNLTCKIKDFITGFQFFPLINEEYLDVKENYYDELLRAYLIKNEIENSENYKQLLQNKITDRQEAS